MLQPITAEAKFLAEQAMKYSANAIHYRNKLDYKDNWWLQKQEKIQWAKAHAAIRRIEKLVSQLEDNANYKQETKV